MHNNTNKLKYQQAIVAVDGQGLITAYNPAFLQLNHIQDQDVVGQPFNSICQLHHKQSKQGVCFDEPCRVVAEDYLLLNSQQSAATVSCTFEFNNNTQNFSGGIIAIDHPDKNREKISEEFAYAQYISTQERLESKLKSLEFSVTHDPITKLYNRSYFEAKIEELIFTSKNMLSEHILIFLDLDQFKMVNDSSGFKVGDELLKTVAQLIKSKLRTQDIIARFGGDEFGIQLVSCSRATGLRIAEKMREVIEDLRFETPNAVFTLTASLGVAIINRDSKDAMSVMKKADMACNLAKDEGRNRVCFYEESSRIVANRCGELACVQQIQNAINHDRFQLFAQKIIALNNDQKPIYEILIRMLDKHNSFIQPNHFLPAAERYQLISRVDRWVVQQACKLLEANPQFLEQCSHIAINLSGQSLNDPTFSVFLDTTLSDYTFAKNKLCFEITETGTIANLGNALDFIHNMKRHKIQFALDDFGSGLSSFAYLKNLPVDYLKIDGMFVKNMTKDKIDYAMVKSINDIGHVMGKKIVAEFVEDESILNALKELGVDYAQGYCVAEPENFEEILKKSD